MGFSSIILWTFPVVLALCALHGEGLEIRPAMEGSCAGMSNYTEKFIDENWISNTRRWYTIGGSKFHLYRAVIHHFHDVGDRRFSEMPEHEFYYESCIQMHRSPNNLATMTGFEVGRRSLYNFTSVSRGVNDVTPVGTLRIPMSPYVRGPSRHRITLTDNRTFYVYTICYLDLDQKGWGVYSTVPVLSEDTIREIEEHVAALGFDREQFVFFKYNSCKPGVLNQNVTPRSGPTSTTRRPSPNSSTMPPSTSTMPPTTTSEDSDNMGWGRMSRISSRKW